MLDTADPLSSPASDEERTVLAALPMGQLVFGLSQGVLPTVLCQTAGVSLADLTDRDRFVPHAWYYALWDALRTHCPGVRVGIAFGKFMSAEHLGFAGQVFRNARDGLDALHKLVRFGCLFDSRAARYPSRIEVDDDKVSVLVSPHLVSGMLECVEACLFGFVTQLHGLTGRPARLLALRLTLEDQRHRDEYERFFACPIQFGSRDNAVIYERASLMAPIRGANLEAVDRIEAYVAESLAAGPGEALLAKLQRALQLQLRGGSFSLREAARALGMSARVLQRRLSEQGRSFGQVLEELRRAEAIRVLSETDAAVYEVAFCLGYQDVSSFNRAFKRWLGMSPRDYRAQKRA